MYMFDSIRPTRCVLILLALSFPSFGQNQADEAVAKEFVEVEKKMKDMAATEDDKLQRAGMEAFRSSCQAFVDRHEPKSAQLTTGHFDLARAYLHLSQPAKAAAHLETLNKLAPENPRADDAVLLLGDAYRALDRLPEAVALFAAFVKERPKSEKLPFARLGLGTSLLLSMDFQGAVAHLSAVRSLWPDHQVAADAALQLIEAHVNAGNYSAARGILTELLSKYEEAPELSRLRDVLAMLGQKAPDLQKVAQWIGAPASNIARLKGRVVVLCFFVNWNVPCALELQFLSDMLSELEPQGLTVWGVTKAYKAGKGSWDIKKEAAWLAQYRKSPQMVVERELQVSDAMRNEDPAAWAELKRPITYPLALTSSFDTHKAFLVRGVPWVVVIDKQGVVRMMKEGGSSSGGFQRKLVSRLVKQLLRQ